MHDYLKINGYSHTESIEQNDKMICSMMGKIEF